MQRKKSIKLLRRMRVCSRLNQGNELVYERYENEYFARRRHGATHQQKNIELGMIKSFERKQ